jgi:hypothetical protein
MFWRKRQPFDPAELVELARRTLPDEPWVAEALTKCTEALVATPYNVYFVDSEEPNEPGSEWQFRENVVLDSPADGDIVLDILKDGRVGSIEFVGRKLRDGAA